MTTSARLPALVLTAVLAAATVGCASPAQWSQPVQNAPGTQFGQVQSVELVRAESQTTGAGAVLGGLIGAVVGRQIGDGNGRFAATGVGAVGGAIIGNQLEKQQRRSQDLQRVVVRLESGTLRSFDLPGGTEWRVGDRVRVQNNEVVRI